MKSRRISTDLVWLFLLLLVFCLLSFHIASSSSEDSENSFIPHRTTVSSARDGWKAFYMTLQKTQTRPVSRWTRGPSDWPKEGAVMICGPAFGDSRWTKEEAQAALSWVTNGGTLVLLSDDEDELTQALSLEPRSDDDDKSTAKYTPAQPFSLLARVKSVQAPSGSGWKDTDGNDGVSLLKGAHRFAVVLPRGKGWVAAIASPVIADNETLGKGDNAAFLVQTIDALATRAQVKQAGAILFDEFHQGFADDDSLWSALGRPGQLVTYQLLVLVLLAAYSMSRRFGIARPTQEASRVSSEYVTSLANLYQRARASDAALESIYRSFKRDFCAGSGYSQDTTLEELVPAVMSGLGYGASDTLVGRVQQLMDTCEAKINAGAKAVPESELMALARRISDMRKELQLGGTQIG